MFVFSKNYVFLIIFPVIALLQACSGNGSPQATVTVGNEASYSQVLATTRNTPLLITLVAPASSETELSFTVTTQPANGSLTGQLSGFSPEMTYTPNLDFAGTDSFTFAIKGADGSTGNGTVTIQVLDSIEPTADTDGDGLLDLDEINKYGTNENLSDTDGDGFSDFDEVVDLGFNAEVNNYRFNPLIADTPEIDVRIASVPDVRINYTLTDGTSKTVGTSRSQTSSQSVSISQSESESTSVSEAHTASVEVSTEVSVSAEVGLFSPPSAETEASVSTTAGYSYEHTTTNEQTSSWSQEQTEENSNTFEESESFEENNSVSASEGEISVAVDVINRGHVSFTLNNLFLSSTYVRPRGANPLVPVGNLAFDNAGGSFPAVTLSPGQSTGVLNFKGSGVNLQKIKDILANSRGFSVRPTLYTLLDQNDQAYNFAGTAIVSNDAMIMVDYNGNNGLENINKMVAVNGVAGKQISLADALNKVLKLNVTTTTDAADNTYIDSVNGLNNAAPEAIWLILHARQTGNNQVETTIYTTPADKQNWEARNANVKNLVANYDMSAITLGAGDVLHLVYLQDNDLDGLSNRMEFFYRSDPNNPDTDADGLADGVEAKDGWSVAYEDVYGANIVRKVYSDPTKVDTDLDGRNDDEEANLSATDDHLRQDPRRFDTDGDGLDDLIDDFDNSVNPAVKTVNEYDDLRITAVSATANIIGSGPYDVDVQYDTPAILSNAAANGVTEYNVVTLRYNDSSGQGNFPPPQRLQDGLIYLVGDTVPCDNGATGCSWQVVDVFTATSPATHTFTDSGLLKPEDNTVSPPTPADVAKYVFDVAVNGRYTRQAVDKLATSKTETLEIHMISGRFSNVRTVFSTNTTNQYRNAAMTSVFGWMNGGKPVYLDYLGPVSSTHGAYAAYDGSSGGPGAGIGNTSVGYSLPYSLMRPGDGKLDITWFLYVDANLLNSNPVSYPISASFARDWYADIGNVKNLNAEIDKDIGDGNGVTPYHDMFVHGTGSSTLPAQDAQGHAVYTIVVPALPGSHYVELFIREYDYARGEYNKFVYPPDAFFPNRPYDGHDALELTRDEQGIWTAKALKGNDNQPALGGFRDGANVTRKGNINPIKYLTHTVRLSDKDKPGSTSMQADFAAEYHIYVK